MAQKYTVVSFMRASVRTDVTAESPEEAMAQIDRHPEPCPACHQTLDLDMVQDFIVYDERGEVVFQGLDPQAPAPGA